STTGRAWSSWPMRARPTPAASTSTWLRWRWARTTRRNSPSFPTARGGCCPPGHTDTAAARPETEHLRELKGKPGIGTKRGKGGQCLTGDGDGVQWGWDSLSQLADW